MIPAASDATRGEPLELSIVLPCLNEAATLAQCIREARTALELAGIAGEIIVADNGSTDGSPEIAKREGARLLAAPAKGYGHALRAGIAAARAPFVLIGDADASYDFGHAPRFVEKLREGFDLVMGDRFAGGIAPGAMPWKNRYLGNPLLSFIGRLFFRGNVTDFHCGLRAFTASAIRRLELRTTGMEFASEMVIKAQLHRMKIAVVPTILRPDGRDRPPHLRPWRDGWRHLRFMLLFSPRWLFLYPGLACMLAGGLLGGRLIAGPLRLLRGVTLDVHTLLFCAVAVMIGFQAVLFALLSKRIALRLGLRPPDPAFEGIFRFFGLEVGLILGVVLSLAGLGLSIAAVWLWSARAFGDLDPTVVLRWVTPGATLLTVGCQVVLTSLLLSVLDLGLWPGGEGDE